MWNLTTVGALAGMIMLGAPLGAQEQESATAGEQAFEAYEAMKEYTFTRKEEAAAWLSQRLRDLDAQIDEFGAAVGERGEQAREQGYELMDELREQRANAAEQMERLQAASADAWEGVKRTSLAAFGELEEAVVQVRSRFE